MWKEFKEFAFEGNVLDLAVAVIIGAAFGKIITSLVENIFMPIIGVVLSGVNFEGLSYKVGDAEIMYGAFIQSVFDFLIIALCIFLFIRLLMKFKRKQEEVEEEEVEAQEALLTEIRDLLKEQNQKN
ncbi:large conductance mechanosensitive channel protein MscL [Ornithinibacillus sp. 4-3]|uniref:Large-conductance mechanosensitive channel n=1 Tax=Ornithinibacillus sp. 4-3 TaxID=3231488 RepID=A0AB39HMS3_9BACI